jgi:hypothetical protein
MSPTVVREIKLNRGFVALVDAADFDKVNEFRWTVLQRANDDVTYARRSVGGRGQQKSVRMHRFILELKSSDPFVDHIDRNGLNNTRANLRLCTNRENLGNMRKRVGSSQYKGVRWHTHTRKWEARIRTPEGRKCLGLFACELDAALAYDVAARGVFGAFALINFPGGGL